MEFLSTFVAAAGGTAIVIAGLWKFVGKILAGSIVEGIKAEHARQLEDVKHQLTLLRGRSERYDATRFRLYGELWAALFDLKRVADDLWRVATYENFMAFGRQLVATEAMIGRKRLLLTARDAEVLDELIDAMLHYHVGKQTLLELRRSGDFVDPADIYRAIEENRAWRDRYADVLPRIEAEFRSQIEPLVTHTRT